MSARSSLVVLAVSVLMVDLGCSEFRARRRGESKPELVLGSEMPNRDIYAKNEPKTSKSSASAEPIADAMPDPGLAGEIIPQIEPAKPESSSPSEPIVKLQPPVRVGPAKPVFPSTSRDLPEDSRSVAASNRPAVKETTKVVAEARTALNQLASYQLSLKRQERVNGVLLPAEDLLMSIRRSPKAARLTWVDGPHRGREVIYRSDEPGGLMHVNMADSKFPVPRLSLAPDSPMVMKNSRHPITEAGLDPLVASLEQADRTGSLNDLGMETPPQLDRPHRGLLRKSPIGEVWKAYLDPENHLPALVECRDQDGDLLEYYLFRNLQTDLAELASADAFTPDIRWGPPRGLFGRASARASGDSSTMR